MSQPVGKRRKSRELAMQMLFQMDVGKQTPDQVRQTFWKAREETIDLDTRGFAEDLFRVATAREEEVDALIEQHSAHWRIPRHARAHRHQRIARDCQTLLGAGVSRLPERHPRRDCEEQKVASQPDAVAGRLADSLPYGIALGFTARN